MFSLLRSARHFKRKKAERNIFLSWLLPIIIFIIWQVVTTKGSIPAYVLPSPIAISKAAIDFALGNWNLTPYSGSFFEHLAASTIRVLCGFGLAAVLGLPLGFLTGRIALLKKALNPLIHMLRAIPGIGWLPIAIIWFGVGGKTTIFLIFFASFFPIYTNAAQGAEGVPPLLIRAAKMLGADKFSLYTSVIIPASLPSILTGLRLGLGVSWGYLVLGELTGVTKGLGAVMMDSRMLGHADMVIISMIYIGLAGRLSDLLLTNLFKRMYSVSGGDIN